MAVKLNYTTDADKYAECYRLQELLRLEFNTGKLTKEEHNKREDVVIAELLKLRAKIKNDVSINTSLDNVSLTE